MIEGNKDLLERIAQALLGRETVDREEIRLLGEGKELPPVVAPEPQPLVAPGAAGRPRVPAETRIGTEPLLGH